MKPRKMKDLRKETKMAKCPKCGAEVKGGEAAMIMFGCNSQMIDGDKMPFYESPECFNRQISRLTAEVERLKDMLTSARVIAQRRGEDTAWDIFDAIIAELGVGSVTARTYRQHSSDSELKAKGEK